LAEHRRQTGAEPGSTRVVVVVVVEMADLNVTVTCCQLRKVDEEINLSKFELSQLDEDAPACQKKELKTSAAEKSKTSAAEKSKTSAAEISKTSAAEKSKTNSCYMLLVVSTRKS
jgi:hypothetical protein